MKKVLFALLTTFALVACQKGGDNDPPKSITVANQQQLTQTVYADNNAGKSGVTFTTAGAWSSSISEGTTAKSSRAAAPNWISIDPASGDKAGNYTINITLGTNLTGEKRSATITIMCAGEKIAITVTQEATTADGKLPDEVDSGSGTFTNTNGVSVKIVKAYHEILSNKSVKITFESEDKNGDGNADADFIVWMYNPLLNGRLATGQYNSIGQTDPYQNNTFIWGKSVLSDGYSDGGTVQVDLTGDTYTFTLNIHTDDDKTITGSYSGKLYYMNEEIKVSEVKLDKTELSLEINRSATLVATILPENALNKTHTWSSSAPDVATVNEQGYVQAVKTGTATITVTSEDGNKTAQCVVTVTNVASIGLCTFSNSISGGTPNIVKATHEATSFFDTKVRFYDAENYSYITFTFHNRLTNGRLTPGTYNFATDGYQQGTVVSEKPHHIADATAQSGTVTVTASGDVYTITLDLTGIYYPPKQDGVSCKITGEYIGKFIYINEFTPVTGVSLNKSSLELQKGSSETLTATILPANASYKEISWSSSDSNVATAYSGRVDARNVGTTTITATTQDGAKVASCVVTVVPREVTGSGTFTYKFDDNSQTSTFSPTYVVNTGSSIIRFMNDDGVEALCFRFQTPSNTLEAGVYEWETGSTSPRKWHAQKGDFGDKMLFYCEGVADPGTITVAKSGDNYTITLNWNVSETGGGGRLGKITGTYTGKILNK